jgi:hypothetical protein
LAIEIRWDAPVFDGGSIITDYVVYWDEGRGTDEFVVIGNTLAYQTFTINAEKSNLFISGEWYVFRVAAVNIIGEGLYSESVAILAAEVPTAPDMPTLVS